jgi:hypothetical protein
MKNIYITHALVATVLFLSAPFAICQTGVITGFVRTTAGLPIAGVAVSIEPGGQWTVSLPDGSYTLSGVPAGVYKVKASKKGFASRIENEVVVTAGQAVTLNFTLGPAGTLAGYVRDQSGLSLSDVTISVVPGGYSTVTNVSGTYIMSDIPPGVYSVNASKAGYVSKTRSEVVVEEGQVTVCAFTLALNIGSISGFVRDTNGNPIAGASITTDKGGYSTTSNADGSYTLVNVVADTYSLTASKLNYQPQTIASVVVVPGQVTTCNFSLNPLSLSGTNIALNAVTYLECGHNLASQIGLYAHDGSTSTKWCCLHNGLNTPGEHTLAYDLGSNCLVSGFVVKHASTGGETANFNTKSFVIESAPRLSGPWSEEFSVTNDNKEASNTLIYPTPKVLRYVRLRVTQPNYGVDWAVRIPEFEVWGTAGTPAPVKFEAEDYDSGASAVEGTDYHDTTPGNTGGLYRTQDVDIESCSEGGYNVGWLANGEWMKYRFKGGGTYRVLFRCDGTQAGSCYLEIDGVNRTGIINIPKGSWQVWNTFASPPFSISNGNHILKFVVTSGGFNINYFVLEPL